MAKRKVAAETREKADTKKPKVPRGQSGGTRGKVKKDPEIKEEEEEEEEEVKRKAKSNPRTPRPAANHVTKNTSKYFQQKSPTKAKESEEDDDNDGIPGLTKGTAVVLQPVKKEKDEEDSEEEEDWEEVEELSEPLGPSAPAEPALPSQPVEIEIETPDVIHKRLKREKRKAEFETYLRRMVNRFNKDVVVETHKVHLMCLLANGMFRNRLCMEPDLLAITLSLLPIHFTMVTTERRDQNYLSGLLKWFGATFTLTPELACEERPDPRAALERRLGSLTARDHQEMTHLFLLVLRSLQFFCRLVVSLQPLSMKPPATKGKAKSSPSEKSSPGKPPKNSPLSDTKPSPGTKRSATGQSGGRGGKKPKKESTGVKEEEVEKEKRSKERTTVGGGQKPKNSTRRSVASKVSYKEQSSEEEGPSEGEEFQLSSEGESEDSEDGVGRGRRGKGKGKTPARRRSGGKRNAKSEDEYEDCKEEEEEEDEEGAGKAKGTKRERRKNKGPGADEWLEVYLSKPGWVCVDIGQGLGQPQRCSQNATQPLTYVVAVDDEGKLKDLSRKYDPNWMTSSRKRRVDEEWWEETLEPFLGEETERDLREDKELQARLLDKPLPTSVGEFKNHPLYALERHLLKDCIHTLHSRDTWLKEARTVRLGEEPYKMVRGFSNRSRKVRMVSEEKDKKDLPLFGEWQTEEYQPPLAIDGKVPRNDYGNVYLFKPCMLPVGCVHLRLPNLHRVAKKLDIDCVSAITGFDFHGGYSHAVTDGYIVCEEHEEILRAAWAEDQEIQRQKEKEKREKRAVSNWTLLVKGLLIKERLKRRYGHQGPKDGGGLGQANAQDREGEAGLLSDEEEDGGEASGPASQTAAVTLSQSWPQNRQEEQDKDSASGAKKTTQREKRGQQKHMFPFEKV